MVIATFLPTTSEYAVIPKSLRLIVVTPVNRMGSLPTEVAGAEEKDTFNVTGRVTPRAVRLPWTTPEVVLVMASCVP